MDSPRQALELAKAISQSAIAVTLPPEEGLPSHGQAVIPFSLFRGTRGYLEKVVHQVNGSYENGWYDASAVMIRRLVETLIIEAFEKYGIANQIQRGGDFFSP